MQSQYSTRYIREAVDSQSSKFIQGDSRYQLLAYSPCRTQSHLACASKARRLQISTADKQCLPSDLGTHSDTAKQGDHGFSRPSDPVQHIIIRKTTTETSPADDEYLKSMIRWLSNAYICVSYGGWESVLGDGGSIPVWGNPRSSSSSSGSRRPIIDRHAASRHVGSLMTARCQQDQLLFFLPYRPEQSIADAPH